MAASCVETISDTNQVYDCSNIPKKEIVEFFEQLSSKQFMMIQEFFEKMPKLSHTLKVTNPNTGVESEVVLEGLASFFA
jgi:DNA-directed RNA polymerase specialized sigma subunit